MSEQENFGCEIDGVDIRPMSRFGDNRGWLAEFFRVDSLNHTPSMGYVSLTEPGRARGPHEHTYQTDLFVFGGPGEFEVFLYDARPESPTYKRTFRGTLGAERMATMLIPPRVIHAYRCVSETPGVIVNLPDKLYAGVGKSEAVDEIRHEDNADSPFFDVFDAALFVND